MAKIARKYLAHFINAAAPAINGEAAAAVYERLGKDLEEYNVELSAQVDKMKNILGETSVNISSYEKSASVEPYYADKDTAMFTRLQAIIDGDLIQDDLKTDVVEVKLWNEADGKYPAIKEALYGTAEK